jgi:hypothetical protein
MGERNQPRARFDKLTALSQVEGIAKEKRIKLCELGVLAGGNPKKHVSRKGGQEARSVESASVDAFVVICHAI